MYNFIHRPVADDYTGNPRSTINGLPYIDTSLQNALIEVGESRGSSWFGRKVLLWNPQKDEYFAVNASLAFFYITSVRVREKELQEAFHMTSISRFMGPAQHAALAEGLLSCMSEDIHKERYAYSLVPTLQHTYLVTSGELPLLQAKKRAILTNTPIDAKKEGLKYTSFDESLAKALIEVGKQNLSKKFFEWRKVVVLNNETQQYEIITAPFFNRYAPHHTKVDGRFLREKFTKASLPKILIPRNQNSETLEDIQAKRTFFTKGLLSCFDYVDKYVKADVYSAFMSLVYAPKKSDLTIQLTED